MCTAAGRVRLGVTPAWPDTSSPPCNGPVPCKELVTCKGLVRAFSPWRPAQCESLISLAQCESLLPLTIGAGTMPPMYMAGVAPGAPPAMPGAAIMPGGGIIMGPKPASSGWQRRQRVGMHVRTLRSTIGRPTASSTIHRQKPKDGPPKEDTFSSWTWPAPSNIQQDSAHLP